MLKKLTVTYGNKKLGNIPNLSMPSYISCPGKSEWCQKKCYAHKYEKLYPQCTPAYTKNMILSKSPDFVNSLIAIIQKMGGPYFRIHPSGDFYNTEYIDKWFEVCQALPNTLFCCYTRSWMIPELLSSLKKLKKLKNLQLFFSVDPTMPLPPEDGRIAFIETDKRANGITCLEQTGKRETCLKCGYCYKNTKKNVIFKIH